MNKYGAVVAEIKRFFMHRMEHRQYNLLGLCAFVLNLTISSSNKDQSKCCTLIDNAYCKLSAKSLSSSAGILHTNLSDRYPYFLSLRLHNVTNKKDFYVKKELIVKRPTSLYYETSENLISSAN